MSKEMRVGGFWLPVCGSDRTLVLLNSQRGPQGSEMGPHNSTFLLGKFVNRTGPVPAACQVAGTWRLALRTVPGLVGGGWPRDGTAPAFQSHPSLVLATWSGQHIRGQVSNSDAHLEAHFPSHNNQ